MKARRRWILAAAVVGSLAASGILLGSPTRGQAAALPGQGDYLAMYANDQGITTDEAAREFDLMSRAGQAEPRFASAIGAAFAGLYIQHRPTFEVVVLSTDPAADGSFAITAAATGLNTVATFKVVSYPLETLQADALLVARALGRNADVWVNVADNVVDVQLQAGTPIPSGIGETVRVREVPTVGGAATNIYGGLPLSNGCTIGFSVKQTGTTIKGIVTAGHCTNTQAYSGTNLPFQGEWYDGSHDEQWHTTPGLTALNRVKTAGIGYATITGKTSHGLQAIGSWVCKTGNTTGFDCGYLDSRGACATWVPHFNCTFHRVHNDSSDLSSPGDSGGPVYYAASDAWGIISGETWNLNEGCTCTLIYTAIDYVESGLLVSVLTQ